MLLLLWVAAVADVDEVKTIVELLEVTVDVEALETGVPGTTLVVEALEIVVPGTVVAVLVGASGQ